MLDARPDEDPRAFISRLAKMLLEADDEAAALAALPQVFDPAIRLFANGKEFGWDWFEEHMRQVPRRLGKVRVEVSHAVRAGALVMDRHIVSGIDLQTHEPWMMEVMAAYELTQDNKIIRQYELTSMREGEYVGDW